MQGATTAKTACDYDSGSEEYRKSLLGCVKRRKREPSRQTFGLAWTRTSLVSMNLFACALLFDHALGTKCNIEHVHLAVGSRNAATSMTVSFASLQLDKLYWEGIVPTGYVKYGTNEESLDDTEWQQEESQRYSQVDVRGNNYTSPYYHHVTLTHLQPHTRYYYQCGCTVQYGDSSKYTNETHVGSRRTVLRRTLQEESFCAKPEIQSFVTAPHAGSDQSVNFAVLGDLGRCLAAPDTVKHLTSHTSHFDAIVLLGDIAYNGGLHHHWEYWFKFMDENGNMDQLPWQVAPGNHDVEEQVAGGRLFAGYETRFRMPQVQPLESDLYPTGIDDLASIPYPLPHDFGNSFYAYTYGPAHIIVLNSYASVDPGSKQYVWLKNELEQEVDRTLTPWVFVMTHVPFYNTFKIHHHDVQLLKQRQHIEPLLREHLVNAIFSGHVHAYMRTKGVFQEKPDPLGPIHFVVGEGGGGILNTDFHNETPEEWVAVRDTTSYGYGSLHIYNRTHAQWEWIHTHHGNNDDWELTRSRGSHTENHVFHSNVTSPPVFQDSHVLLNRYYTEESH